MKTTYGYWRGTARLLLIAAIVFAVAGGCTANTQLETSWKDPSVAAVDFKKVVVLVLNSTPGDRRAQEDALAGQITKTTAVASHTLVPDDELADHEKVKQRITQAGFDGALVLRMLDSTTETTYVPGSASYWYDGPSFVPYQYGYNATDTVVRAEVGLYSVPDRKLLWVGSSSSYNPANAREFALAIAQASAAELRKQGLLK